MARPKLIITVGKKAESSLRLLVRTNRVNGPWRIVSIQHPTAMLGQGGTNSVAYDRALLQLQKYEREYLRG